MRFARRGVDAVRDCRDVRPQAASCVDDFLSFRGSLRGLCLRPSIKHKGATFALVTQTLKVPPVPRECFPRACLTAVQYRAYLDEAMQACEPTLPEELPRGVTLVLCYDLLVGQVRARRCRGHRARKTRSAQGLPRFRDPRVVKAKVAHAGLPYTRAPSLSALAATVPGRCGSRQDARRAGGGCRAAEGGVGRRAQGAQGVQARPSRSCVRSPRRC